MENPIVYFLDLIIGTFGNMFGHRMNEKSSKIVFILLTILHLSYEQICGDLNSGCFLGAYFTDKDIPLTTFQVDTNKPQYYRYLYIDETTASLFVGAENNLIKLNLTDISKNSKNESLLPLPKDQSVCKVQAKPDEYCQNHIKYIMRMNSTEIFACGTGADSPQLYSITINSNGSLNVSNKTTHKAVCPFDPFDNSTVVYIENGNPSDISALYTGIIDQYKTPYIIRPELTKDDTRVSGKLQNVENMIWLNEPQFVGSFDVGSEVLFFFREIGIEFKKKIVSRVAKVCKSDKGGSSALVNKWTTFQKAQLNCSIPGEFPFYFDEIQDVVMYNNTFYALFTTNSNGVTASAICAYEISSIQASFNGLFKRQESDQSQWLPVPESEVPNGAGKCVNDSLTLVDEVERFMTVNPLMDQAVKQQYGQPMFIMEGVLMQKLAIDVNESYDNNYVFFSGSNSGDIFKLLIAVNITDKKPQGHVANRFSVLKKEPVWAMELNNKQMYVGTDTAVTQFSILTCSKHTKIDKCLYDPYCRWTSINTKNPWFGSCIVASDETNGGQVFSFDDLKSLKNQYLAAIKNSKEDTLSFQELNTTTLTFNYPFSLDGKTVTWTFAKDASSAMEPIQITGKFQINYENSLIIMKFDKNDEGIYKAVLTEGDSSEVVLVQKNLVVGTRANADELWMAKFEEWCDMFNNFKNRVGCTDD